VVEIHVYMDEECIYEEMVFVEEECLREKIFLWRGMQYEGKSSEMEKCMLEETVPQVEDCL
jgi:hypothetical protein